VAKKITRVFLIGTLLVLTCASAQAQKKDSLALSRKVKSYAVKTKFTHLLYNAIFVDPEPVEYPVKPGVKEGKKINPYLKYDKRVIRKINILVHDPFGHSVTDTLLKDISYLEKMGNRWHTSTRHWVVANNLLFKENQKLDALTISESERLLRQSIYVNDARIFVTPVKNSKDSVDVNVVMIDKWSITIPSAFTESTAYATFKNYNTFGTGHQFEQYVGWKAPDLINYSGFYNVANIDDTYISSRLGYASDRNGTQVSLSFERPFFSPLAKWAGGSYLAYSQQFHPYRDTLDGLSKRANLFNLGYDFWGGKSFKINNNRSFFDQSYNLIAGGRYFGHKYLNRGRVAFNELSAFPNLCGFIGNIGFALQQYYKDRYIYRFGANEDVPEGLILQFLYGGVKQEYMRTRYYVGAEIARAKHFGFGYVTGTLSSAVFFNRFMSNNVTTNYKLSYFSDLFRVGKWYLRQFTNFNLVHGINKPAAEKTTLTADDLYGFSSGSLQGNTKMIVQMEAVAYAPYSYIGFRFAPVLSGGIGMIGDSQKKLIASNIYQGYSLGLMIRNENLLNSTFLVSVGLYPFLPNGESYVFRYNPVTSFTLRVRAFSVAKPGFITY